MRATQKLHEMGQSIWLDNIHSGAPEQRHTQQLHPGAFVASLTSNPTIFDPAIKNSHDYDEAIGEKSKRGKSDEDLFFELALEDLQQAADLFRPKSMTNGWRGRLGVARSLAAVSPRHGRHPCRSQGPGCSR